MSPAKTPTGLPSSRMVTLTTKSGGTMRATWTAYSWQRLSVRFMSRVPGCSMMAVPWNSSTLCTPSNPGQMLCAPRRLRPCNESPPAR